MKRYVIYNGSGKILRYGTCSGPLEAQIQNGGEKVLEITEQNITPSDHWFKIVDGELVNKTPRSSRPPRRGEKAEISPSEWQALQDRVAELEERL
jgi:hypothetical protein